MGRINSIDDVYRIAENLTAYTRPEFNKDFYFIHIINQINDTVEDDDPEYNSSKQYSCTGDLNALKKAFTIKEGTNEYCFIPINTYV